MAVLEEGLLAGPKKSDEKWSIMKGLFHRKRRKLYRLFALMQTVGNRHGGLTIAQVAMAFVATKGIVPVCGCRKPNQVQELYRAANTVLTPVEMRKLEQVSDEIDVKIFGKDLFRFAIKK